MEDARELTVRKRRVASDAADPIAATATWLDDLLKQKTADGRRVMSPLTEQSVRLLLAKLQDAARAPEEARVELTQAASLAEIREHITRRLETDEKYAAARWKLEQLEKDTWYIRYGEYHATSLKALRNKAREIADDTRKAAAAARIAANREAKKFGKTKKANGGIFANAPTPTATPEEEAIKTFISKPWIEVDSILDEEEKNNAKHPPSRRPPTPMLDLVRELVSQIPMMTTMEARESMKIYALRNDIVHSHAGELARTGRLVKLATKFSEDLTALVCERSITEMERDATRASIMYNVGLFFEEFNYDEDIQAVVGDIKSWPQDDKGRFIRPKKRALLPTYEDEGAEVEDDEICDDDVIEDTIVVRVD